MRKKILVSNVTWAAQKTGSPAAAREHFATHRQNHGTTGRVTAVLDASQDRNGSCRCGSGKKFKKCCFLQAY